MNDYPDLGTPRYTKSQMVDQAIAAGYEATERLFTDWEEAGLIDRPTKRGLGRGKGIAALWPESQLRLWLLLLQKRGEARRIPTLCNVSVGLWLYFGDDYATLRQARRCMARWTRQYGSSRGHKDARQTARRILDDLPLSASKNAKAELTSEMASVLLRGIKDDDERRRILHELLSAMDEVEGPNQPSALAELVLVRLLASHHLNRGSVPDHIFEWARAWHLYGLRTYMEALDKGALPEHVAAVGAGRPDFNQLIPSACRDMMSAVGMAMSLRRDEVLPAPLFHPDAWRDGPAAVKVGFQGVRLSGIALPDGSQHGHIQIQVEGSIPHQDRSLP